jgi:hypothetical protein
MVCTTRMVYTKKYTIAYSLKQRYEFIYAVSYTIWYMIMM